MLHLPNVWSINGLQELRFLYDRVETEVRSLGLPTTNYGPMLVPALNSFWTSLYSCQMMNMSLFRTCASFVAKIIKQNFLIKPEFPKEILFKERRRFICMEKRLSTKQRRNTMKF